jgi:hypothetical protein
MGIYINPLNNQSKLDFLNKNGRTVSIDEIKNQFRQLITSRQIPVCWVNNGTFDAAAIIYNDLELKEFTQLHDIREKQWFIIPLEKLTPDIIGIDISKLIV